MNKSESIKNIAIAMCKAQSEMSGAQKAQANPFLKSKYADLSEVIKAVKKPFADNGLSYVQFPIEENGRIGVETILMHESGEYISNSFTVQLSKQDAQGAGSAITYCRRYGLQAVAGTPSEDDDGNASSPANNQQDVKWYKEPNFENDLPAITDAIKNGTPPSDVVAQIESNGFKLSKEMKDKIGAI